MDPYEQELKEFHNKKQKNRQLCKDRLNFSIFTQNVLLKEDDLKLLIFFPYKCFTIIV